MNSTATRVIAGFLAGAAAVLVFHQGLYFLMQQTGAFPLQGTPWRMNPVAPYGVPAVVNQMFWGGLWGIVFGLLYERLPASGVAKGIIFGALLPLLVGSWLVVPILKGLPIVAGFVPVRMLTGFLLNAVGYGIGVGLLYPLLTRTMGAKAA